MHFHDDSLARRGVLDDEQLKVQIVVVLPSVKRIRISFYALKILLSRIIILLQQTGLLRNGTLHVLVDRCEVPRSHQRRRPIERVYHAVVGNLLLDQLLGCFRIPSKLSAESRHQIASQHSIFLRHHFLYVLKLQIDGVPPLQQLKHVGTFAGEWWLRVDNVLIHRRRGRVACFRLFGLAVQTIIAFRLALALTARPQNVVFMQQFRVETLQVLILGLLCIGH